MTKAERWATLREWFLFASGEYPGNYDEQLMDVLKPALLKDFPIYVDDCKCGDQGTVDFDDGSSIKWDWDNGDFEVEGKRLHYPDGKDDPLFWKQ